MPHRKPDKYEPSPPSQRLVFAVLAFSLPPSVSSQICLELATSIPGIMMRKSEDEKPTERGEKNVAVRFIGQHLSHVD
jgi:hypothetical protein